MLWATPSHSPTYPPALSCCTTLSALPWPFPPPFNTDSLPFPFTDWKKLFSFPNYRRTCFLKWNKDKFQANSGLDGIISPRSCKLPSPILPPLNRVCDVRNFISVLTKTKYHCMINTLSCEALIEKNLQRRTRNDDLGNKFIAVLICSPAHDAALHVL